MLDKTRNWNETQTKSRCSSLDIVRSVDEGKRRIEPYYISSIELPGEETLIGFEYRELELVSSVSDVFRAMNEKIVRQNKQYSRDEREEVTLDVIPLRYLLCISNSKQRLAALKDLPAGHFRRGGSIRPLSAFAYHLRFVASSR